MNFNCEYGGEATSTLDVGWNYSTSTCELAAATSTVPSVENGFTHGEILIFSGVFAIFFLALYAFYWATVHGIKTV